MKVEITAKTVSEAIDIALEKLETTIDEIDYKVIQEPSKGLFGIGTKAAIVSVWDKNHVEEIIKKPTVNEVKEVKKEIVKEVNKKEVINEAKEEKKNPIVSEDFNPEKAAKEFLTSMFDAMKIKVEVETELVDKKLLNINLKGDEMGVIIGKRGQTLDSVQYLVNLVINKGEHSYISVNLDTEDYRKKRKETLETLAINLAKKAKHIRKNVVLEPMNPYERRIIHSTLQNDKYVTTFSEGEEPYRYIVISPKPRNRN